MSEFRRKKHWDNIYQTKANNEVSWYQPKPETSLSFFEENNVDKNARIIDIGGGDSFLVDYLLALGYQNITVLDISKYAIEKAKNRLGDKASLVKWIVTDITTFKSTEKYDVWHDRAAFHFLTNDNDIDCYITIATNYLSKSGLLIIGTFSTNGPKKCSGIKIKQYSKQELLKLLIADFENLKCFNIDHKTPFNTTQNFTFSLFRKN